MDLIGRHRHPVFDLHARAAGQQLLHHAPMGRIKVRNQDESQPTVRRHMREELLEGFQGSHRADDVHQTLSFGGSGTFGGDQSRAEALEIY